jgi:hypothetical protein
MWRLSRGEVGDGVLTKRMESMLVLIWNILHSNYEGIDVSQHGFTSVPFLFDEKEKLLFVATSHGSIPFLFTEKKKRKEKKTL